MFSIEFSFAKLESTKAGEIYFENKTGKKEAFHRTNFNWLSTDSCVINFIKLNE